MIKHLFQVELYSFFGMFIGSQKSLDFVFIESLKNNKKVGLCDFI